MKVIVAGGRDYHDYDVVCSAIADSGFKVTMIISGGATGVDTLAEYYAEENQLPNQVFMADWTTHGKAAGPIRNRTMAEHADALVAIWNGESPGTKNMIETAKKKGLKVYVHRLDSPTESGLDAFMDKGYEVASLEDSDKFAMKREALSALREEWFRLNNLDTSQMDDRMLSVHVGEKNGVLRAMNIIKEST